MLYVEIAASILTLAGIYLGSTTLLGAIAYLGSMVFWWWLTYSRKLWGLVPLNIGSTILSAYNLWSAL